MKGVSSRAAQTARDLSTVFGHTGQVRPARHIAPSWIAKTNSGGLSCDCEVPRRRFAPLGMTTLNFPPILLASAEACPSLSGMKNIVLTLALSLATSVFAASPAEQQLSESIKTLNLSVVHLWAPWCSNCQAELKSGGWLKTVKANPQVKFYFVSVWNGGEDGRAMLTKYEIANQPNVTILADPGPRSGADKIKRFLDLPLSWIPTTWVYKGGDLRFALNYGEVRFDVLQQFFADSTSEWSHKGETN
jgi:thiol-disulfide isomerase/thioredoxin